MDRRSFFRGVGAAAASFALEQSAASYRWVPVLHAPPRHAMSGAWASGLAMYALLREQVDRDIARHLLTTPYGLESHRRLALSLSQCLETNGPKADP